MKVLRFQWNIIKTNRRYVHSGLLLYDIGNEENRIMNFLLSKWKQAKT